MLQLKKAVLQGILIDLVSVCLYLCMIQFEIKEYGIVLFFAIVSYGIMIYFLCKIGKSKLNLCTIFICLCFLFYFGQFLEFFLSGEVENQALSITKYFKQLDVVRVSFITLIYVHVLHSGMLIASGMKNKRIINNTFESYNLIVVRRCSLFIYVIAYPFATYYQYSRFKYSQVMGYGNTLYSNLASSSSMLRLGEFFCGFIISMYIILILAYKGKKFLNCIIISIVPYLVFYVLSGSRLQLALLVLVMLLIRQFWFEPINIKQVVLVVILAVLFMYGITISSNIRNYLGIYSSISSAIGNAFKDTSLLDCIMHILDEFGCQIVSIVCVFVNCPSIVPYNYGKLFLYGIEIIIPNLVGYSRFFFTENTDDAFKYLINNGKTGLGSSFISESFYSFGYWGIILIFLFGIVIWKVSYDIENSKNVGIINAFISFYLAYCIIFTVRSDSFNILSSVFQYCILPIFFIWFTNQILSKKGMKLNE